MSVFVHNSLKFTSLDIDNYCIDQDFEACAIQLNSEHDKLCVLAIYRSPQGTSYLILIWFYTNFLILILTLLFVETLM